MGRELCFFISEGLDSLPIGVQLASSHSWMLSFAIPAAQRERLGTAHSPSFLWGWLSAASCCICTPLIETMKAWGNIVAFHYLRLVCWHHCYLSFHSYHGSLPWVTGKSKMSGLGFRLSVSRVYSVEHFGKNWNPSAV